MTFPFSRFFAVVSVSSNKKRNIKYKFNIFKVVFFLFFLSEAVVLNQLLDLNYTLTLTIRLIVSQVTF